MTLLVPNWLVTPADELKAAPPGPAFLSQFKATNVSRSAFDSMCLIVVVHINTVL